MNHKINIVDLGKMDYKSTWDLQIQFQEKVLKGFEQDTLFLVEHEPVYTLGKNANKNNLLKTNSKDIKVYNVERGGDITYHGPGQLVGYPILNLNNYKKNIAWFMRTLELILIDTLASFNIVASQKEGLTGVWVHDKKIGAQGVRITRWVTMHGFSLNVNTDLKYFENIIPCGIVDCKITSMKDILGSDQNMDLTKKRIAKIFNEIFTASSISSQAV